MSVARRHDLIAPEHPHLSVVRQCELISVSRSGFYDTPVGESPFNLTLMRLIDEPFMETPFYGARQMARHLRRCGHCVGRKRVRRLMARMGLAAVYQKPRTSVPHPDHAVFPYLLRDLRIDRPNHVWCTDITYIPMRRGFLYLVAVGAADAFWHIDPLRGPMDWATRKVLSWRVSNTMEVDFCIAALEEAIERFGKPEIFKTIAA
jgi:putative transposase